LSRAKPGSGIKAERSFPDFALLNPGYSFLLGMAWQNSDALAPREFFARHCRAKHLTRQSMRQCRSFGFAAWLEKLHFSMDHRVKPGGDDAREHCISAK
jgi:hypothetical protein